jgi:flagellar hook-associated protein 3 FlgL
MAAITRLGTASAFSSSVSNITARQAALSELNNKLTAGKRIVRASDDPTGASQAERALTRISRIATDQRALEAQRNTITMAESTLGNVTDALQRFRDLVVGAGNGTYSPAEYKSTAVELQGLRDQIFAMANTKDTNGKPLFAALGSAATPFIGPQASFPGYTFDGLPGMTASSSVAISPTLDGESAFIQAPGRDLVLGASVTNTVTGPLVGHSLTAGPVNLTDSSLIATVASSASPYPAYNLAFTAVTDNGNGTSTASYTITETPQVTAGFPVTPAAVTYPNNLPATIPVTAIPGLQLTLSGNPAVNDNVKVTIDASPSVFTVMDDAIRDIGGATTNNAASQAVATALQNIDLSMERISAVRGQAGALLNRADSISSNQESRSVQLEADRSRAEDLDMVKGISDFNSLQTGYQAALQTYAQVQKLSLFNFIG